MKEGTIGIGSASGAARERASMNFKQYDHWIRSQPGLFLELIRIYLGVGLLIKGVYFLMNPGELAVSDANASLAPLVRAIPYVHVLGGLLLATGWLTRLAALVQIPILVGAIFLVNLRQATSLETREGVEFAALVLFLLVLIFIKGSGQLSLARIWNHVPNASTPHPYQQWVDARSDILIDMIRVYLGIGLILKGVYIMVHREEFLRLLDQSTGMEIFLVAAAHYVIPAHFAGGLLLTLGLLTRWAAAAQIPILAGAILCVYLPRLATMPLRENLEYTTLVLLLLMVLTAYGSGRLSSDRSLEKAEHRRLQPQHA